jgi:acyl-CoA synthetase (AMP-forming)/AMP-acid ligase II
MRELRTLPEALAEAACAETGYVFASGATETPRSYADIWRLSTEVARSLRDAGVRRGDVVAIVLADAEQFLTTFFGATMAGVVPASLYPPMTTAELPHYVQQTATILQSSGARVVVTSLALVPAFEDLRSSCPELLLVLAREQLDAAAADPETLPSLDDIALVQFTSGSTARPKGVALSHRNLAANIEAINGPAGLGITSADSGVSWLPLNHDMGLVGMALGPLYSARPGVLLSPSAFVKRPAEWLRAISRHRATVSFAPNFAYDLCVRRVKDRDLDGLDLSCWRIAGCGAEPVHAPTLRAFAQKFAPVGFRATSFLPSYGLAEHVLAATFPQRGRPLVTEAIADGAIATEIVGCGRAFPDHRIQIVGEDGHPLPDRQIGEILLAGPSVMVGYYSQEELTRETIGDGWLHTGDLGYLVDGELFVCGRVKDIIIVNGRKFHPQDLEWAVDDLAGVRRGRVAAFGLTNHGRADRVVIVVEPSGTVAADTLTDSIRRRISDQFGLYVDDVAIVPSGTIGRTTSGKVQRAATKARFERGALFSGELRAEG